MPKLKKPDRKKLIMQRVKTAKLKAGLQRYWQDKHARTAQETGEAVEVKDTTTESSGHADYDIREIEDSIQGL